MHRKGTVIALVAALALGLSACGGGGGGNLSNEIRDLKQDLADAQAAQTAAEARATAAEAAKAAADAAQATAEAARAAAEAAQMTAEAERDASNAAAAAAAQAQMDAEAAQAAAEAAQAAAEAAQANAEAAQAAAESAQATAEMERDAANAAAMAAAAAQAAAEAERDAANAAQMAAEADRDAANAAAMAAAAAQAAAETAQAAAEAAQAQAMADQAAAEAARDAAVAAQMVAQQAATDAASAQATAEAERNAALAAQTAAEAERDAANSAKAAADAAKAAAEASLATAQADLTVAQGEVQRLTALLGDETNPQAGSVRAELVAAQTRVTELEDMIGSMTDAADAEGSLYAQLAQAKADAAMYKAMVEQAEEQRVHTERVARGNGLSTALSTNRVGTEDRGRTRGASATDLLFDADGSTPLVAPNSTRLPFASAGVTAERTSGGAVTVKVALTDTTDENKFADGSGTAGEQWTSAMLTRSMGEGTTASDEEIMVYTDIGAPTPTLVALEFGSGETFVTIPATRPTDSDATGGGMITPQTAPAAGGPALRYNEDTTFPGMYRGVAGTYTCTTSGGNCVVSTNSDGDVSVEGDLQFKPDNIAAAWDKQDAAYVYFGWWLNKPATASAAHMTEAFSGSVGGNAAAVATAITGTAKYVGPAVGKYAVKSFTAGVQSDAEAGHFTATATLNADFGDASADGTISGTVDGFNTSGDADSSLWKVTLESANLSTDALFNGNTQVTFGGLTVSGAGRYQGSFYDRAADATDTDHANTVAGTFDAHDPGGTANISGAFGGKRQASN